MNRNAATMELVAGYGAYADVSELNAAASSDAPATTFVCVSVISLESSAACASAASAAASAITSTFDKGC
ncbi:LxmA leader domain family RiPP [Streptomyces sp. NPDC048196]|uniref:LxmA leader domain family RiPP n=1 Tax=Streptomyces sp. NPDC048196 TaxID=3154712 RepID=UPI0033C0AF81